MSRILRGDSGHKMGMKQQEVLKQHRQAVSPPLVVKDDAFCFLGFLGLKLLPGYCRTTILADCLLLVRPEFCAISAMRTGKNLRKGYIFYAAGA
jgi:hypothetical protein